MKIIIGKMHMKTRLGLFGTEGSSWWLLVVTILLGINIEPSWSTCYHPPHPVKHGEVQLTDFPKTLGQYPNGTTARVICKPGFHLTSSELKTRVCLGREWTNNPPGDSVCEPDAEGHCGRPPTIASGSYTIVGSAPWTSGSTSSSSSSNPLHSPTGTIMQPTCDSGLLLSCTRPCGRIKCDDKGTWSSLDGELITSCSATTPDGRALVHNDNDTNSTADNHGAKESTVLKSYLVLSLALICILAIGTLIIMALRRPVLCKKRDQCEEGSSMEQNPQHSQHHSHNMMSSSSAQPPLDSLPVAMNTGIFVPGAGYDLQDCHFQDVPIVGTTVFK